MRSAAVDRAAICLVVTSAATAWAGQNAGPDRRWVRLDRLVGHQVADRVVQLTCATRDDRSECVLSLGFPQRQVVRVHASQQGDFAGNGAFRDQIQVVGGPGQDLRLQPRAAREATVSVVVHRSPFGLSVIGPSGKVLWRTAEIALDARAKAGASPKGWRVRFGAADGEAFYGFGERFNAVNQRGCTVQIWGADAGMGSFLGIRATAYKNTPFFLSSRRFAFFWDSSYRLDCDMGKSRPDECAIVCDGPIFDVYVFAHPDPKSSLTYLSELTGKPLLPPRWAFAPWMGREAGAWGRTGHVKGDAIGEMLYVVKRFKKLDIPHSALYAEGPSAAAPRLYSGLKGTDIRVLGWHMPVPDAGAIAQAGGGQRKDYERVLVHRQDGSLFSVPRGCFLQGQPYFDFTHPETIKYVRLEFRDRLKLGLAGTMVDDGDDVSVDAVFHNGQTGRRMHNRYHVHYHRTFNQVFREARGDDFILFARAAGPGSQQFVCFFAGDHPESFDGLESVIHGGLSFAASGFPFWGSDVGGLLPRPFEPLTEPVYKRWVAFAAFSPLMRCHGCSPREPWRFTQRAVKVYKYYAWLRMNLLPTLYSLAVEAHRTGVPLMRLGYLEFPDDANVLGVERAYCFGPDLWFTPVASADTTTRVYLPGTGVWTDLRTGQNFPGGRWVERPADYGAEPLFLRQGAILLAALEDRGLCWGRSMTHGKRRCVVATATNDRPSRRTVHLAPDRSVELTATRNGKVWVLAADGRCPEVGGFVIYGPRPDRVEWAGRVIAAIAGPRSKDTNRPTECWWYDASQAAAKVIVNPDPAGKLRVAF